MNKRALIATDVMSPGGVDTYKVGLVKRALQKGWDVDVVMDQESSSKIGEDLKEISPIYKGPFYHRRHAPQVIEHYFIPILQQRRPDLVHISCGSPWSCLAVREIVLSNQIPLVFTEHYVPLDVNFDWISQTRLEKVYSQAKAVIHVSETNQKLLSNVLSLQALDNIYVIPNGVNLLQLQQKSQSYQERVQKLKIKCSLRQKFSLLFLGRLASQKGADLLIEALAYLKKEGIDHFQLDIYGEGPDLKDLCQKVHDYQLQSNIRFLGWSLNPIQLFSTYDLFIFPSRHEGLPFTLLEALATGIPTLASDIPSHRWVTQQGCLAKLFESENMKSLIKALREWLQDPLKEFSFELQVKRFKWLNQYFDETTNINKTLDLWILDE